LSLRFGVILLTCCLFPALAGADEVEQALKQQFEGKILVLRHPLQGSSQEYDAEGKVLKGGDEGPWTVYSGVLIDKIALSQDKLRFDGRRMLFLFQNEQLTLMEFKRLKDRKDPPFPPAMKLEIALNSALDSAEQARTVMGRVFALNTTDFLDSVPEFWRGSLTDQLIYDPLEKQEAEFQWRKPPPNVRKTAQEAAPDAPKAKEDNHGVDNQDVLRVGKEVKAPKATYTPEPKFSEIARYEKFQGIVVLNVVIGKDGNVHSVRVIRPLGLGLDDSARSMVQTWRFHPALRDGQPVAVEVNIEVSFNLY
jgi:TonB family protein